MAFLPKTPGYLHLSPPVGPSPQLMASWPPRGQFSNSKTARNRTHGSWPQGSGKCCLLPMSCPHWAPGGKQIVHILKAGNQSSTMHNSPVALSHGQHHCGDVRRQPAQWSQGCSACIDFGGHSRRVTPSRTVLAWRFFIGTSLCTRLHILHSPQHPGIHSDPGPRSIVKPQALTAKHAPYRTNGECVH